MVPPDRRPWHSLAHEAPGQAIPGVAVLKSVVFFRRRGPYSLGWAWVVVIFWAGCACVAPSAPTSPPPIATTRHAALDDLTSAFWRMMFTPAAAALSESVPPTVMAALPCYGIIVDV
jgi:hypothetical protein